MKFEDIDRYTESYIQKSSKIFWYKQLFENNYYTQFGSVGSKWSWWAFFFGAETLLYRKCYIEFLLLYLGMALLSLSFTPACLLIPLVNGFLVPHLIYRRFRNVVDIAYQRAPQDEAIRLSIVQQYGGYNSWVVVLVLLCMAFGILIISLGLLVFSLGLFGPELTDLFEFFKSEIPNFRFFGEINRSPASI